MISLKRLRHVINAIGGRKSKRDTDGEALFHKWWIVATTSRTPQFACDDWPALLKLADLTESKIDKAVK